MLFNTVGYGIFLPVVLTLFWASRRHVLVRQLLLLVASYFFYGCWNVKYLVLILASTLLDFGVGRALWRERHAGRRRLLLCASLIGNLGLLGTFKYYNFFVESFADLFGLEGSLPLLSVLLPVGISFYTFQTLSYTIDIYYRRVEPTDDLLEFAVFVAFFPQLVAGPILRAKQFLPQLSRPPAIDEQKFGRGLFRILIGLFKKIVIADFLGAGLVDPVFADAAAYGGADVLLAVYGYALQIYGDFAGYSDIAIGSAMLMGFDIPENFDAPYKATSLRDFWRRWHISLSSWLRDYLYIPLGGSRRGGGRMYLALVATMLLGGLWHGAAWRFVIWGALHGGGLAITRVIQRYWPVKELGNLQRLGAQLLTFHLVCLGWIFFRAPTMEGAFSMLGRLGDWSWPQVWLPSVLLVVAIGFASHLAPLRWQRGSEELFVRMPAVVQMVLLVVALAVFETMSLTNQPFIYFQF